MSAVLPTQGVNMLPKKFRTNIVYFFIGLFWVIASIEIAIFIYSCANCHASSDAIQYAPPAGHTRLICF